MEPTAPSTPLPPDDDDPTGRIARRVLLANLGVVTAGALAVAGLGLTGRTAAAYQPVATPERVHNATSPTPSVRPAATATPAPIDHDTIQKAVTAAFPAKTQGQGLQELESHVVDGVREFDLTCGKIRWEVTPGSWPTPRRTTVRCPGRLSASPRLSESASG